MDSKDIGTPAWFDLTIPNASRVRDFYEKVIGWQHQPVSMGDYEDFSMQLPGSGKDVAGICHAGGPNDDMPPQWMIYFIVADLDASLDAVEKQGGRQVTKIKSFGDSRYVVIRDPAGAVCGLFQQ